MTIERQEYEEAQRYRDVLDTIQHALRCANTLLMTISDEDLAKAERTLGLADAVGHIADPTAYRTALQDGRLDRQRELLKAARSLKTTIKRLEESFAAVQR